LGTAKFSKGTVAKLLPCVSTVYSSPQLCILVTSTLTVARAGYSEDGLYAALAPGYSPALATFAAPIAAPVAKVVHGSYSPPQYSFSYGVNDPHTGDNKEHHETRSGDVVRGSYSLVEPDGTRRTVDYTADAHNGFNAVVHKTPAVSSAPLVKVATPVTAAYSAPLVKVATPVSATYSAPLAKVATPLTATYSAPLTTVAAPVAATYSVPVAKVATPVVASYSAPVAKAVSAPALTYASSLEYAASPAFAYDVTPTLANGAQYGLSRGALAYSTSHDLAYGLSGLTYGSGYGFSAGDLDYDIDISYGTPYSVGLSPALAYGAGLPYGTGHLGATNLITKTYFR
jgi:hypothetical protein